MSYMIVILSDGDYQKRDRIRSNFTLQQMIDLYEKPLKPLEPFGSAAAARMSMEIVRPDPEKITINLGDDTKISLSTKEIQEQIQRDLFASAGIPASMMRGR